MILQRQNDDNICGTVDVNQYQGDAMSVQVILAWKQTCQEM